MDFGAGLKTLSSESLGAAGLVFDGMRHLIELEIRADEAVLKLDGTRVGTVFYGDNVYPITNFYIGGIPIKMACNADFILICA